MENRNLDEVINFMVDLETLGDRTDSPILSIAVTPFNIQTGEMGQHFYKKVELETCLDVGLKITANTFYWWLEQSKEAQQELLSKREPLKDVLEGLIHFIDRAVCSRASEKSNFKNDHLSFESLKPKVALWSNPKEFDLVILQNCIAACKINKKLPWDWRYGKYCVREYIRIAPDIKSNWKYTGTAHDPRSDNENQIGILCKTLKEYPERFSQFTSNH